VRVVPIPNIIAKVPSNAHMAALGATLWSIRAITPKAEMRVRTNANARPKAMPIAVWLASSNSFLGFSKAGRFLARIFLSLPFGEQRLGVIRGLLAD
jgi:hypothetical protein